VERVLAKGVFDVMVVASMIVVMCGALIVGRAKTF
jgi:hypothetical protein